jgi:hypothetical protein
MSPLVNISKSFPQAVLSAGLASYLQASSRLGVAGPGLEGGQVAVLRLYAVVCWLRNDYTIVAEPGERITQLQYLLQLSLRTS